MIIRTLNSEYHIDEENKTVKRVPVIGFPMREDEKPVKLIEFLTPQVGHPFVMLIDLGVPGIAYTHRRTSEVLEIA